MGDALAVEQVDSSLGEGCGDVAVPGGGHDGYFGILAYCGEGTLGCTG